ncbi:MAG: hypothetical protein ACLPXM_18600 [Terriglobales bacterium]
MAGKLMKYYEYICEQSGFTGKVKLAQLTKLPSTRAAVVPDTPEVLAQFQEAVKQLTGKPAPSY